MRIKLSVAGSSPAYLGRRRKTSLFPFAAVPRGLGCPDRLQSPDSQHQTSAARLRRSANSHLTVSLILIIVARLRLPVCRLHLGYETLQASASSFYHVSCRVDILLPRVYITYPPVFCYTMATHASGPAFPSNHIDLTLDDDESTYQAMRSSKRQRTESADPSVSIHPSPFSTSMSLPASTAMSPFVAARFSDPYPATQPPVLFSPSSMQTAYRPPFAGASSANYSPRQVQPPSLPNPPTPVPHAPSPSSSFLPIERSERNVIDLTTSPSPPPPQLQSQQSLNPIPPDLPPKTPVCIGQLMVTALVLYPVPYLMPQGKGEEWVPVRLQHEHNPNIPGSSQTIHIKTPQGKTVSGDVLDGEAFGVVEQKVANSLGPMLGKGLIRLDAKVRKGPPNLPVLSLQMLVYTPKGNIPVVGDYLRRCGLFLDHPSPPYDLQRLSNYHYHNPHNPPPGGHNRPIFASNRLNYPARDNSRWSTPGSSGKSVEIQRSQVDELFKSLKDGDDLAEIEPPCEIATNLYPHQKKALGFLLEREREKLGADGKYSSLWQLRRNPLSHQVTWFHIVTQKEVYDEPRESKGAILADDMGLGKTITCVSLIAATLSSAKAFAAAPLDPVSTPLSSDPLAAQFSGSVWGMPEVSETGSSAKAKAQAAKLQEKLLAEYTRASRLKAKSRATLIICPLSTVSNWEDQFREHWRGEVTVFGGAGGVCAPTSNQLALSGCSSVHSTGMGEKQQDAKPHRIREGTPLKVYIYHGNARRPDPAFLADFDAVITTYATLASEFSKQNRSVAAAEDDDEDTGGGSSDGMGGADVDEHGSQALKSAKSKKVGIKRKKSGLVPTTGTMETPSALQSIHWFRVVLDEAHSIKETSTVGSRASCDLVADRRLCLTGTPVQNKLDDVFALIKFLRLDPFDDKNVWTEFIGSPVKFGQALGIARLQTIMKCITLRRTKETKAHDGQKILALPPRRDELRYLKFNPQEQQVYDQFFSESKAEFNDLTTKNEVMKNYVGILQKILRLRQICDHFELVDGKQLGRDGLSQDAGSYEDIVTDIARDGINASRAYAIFAILREAATTQCVECGSELCCANESLQGEGMDDSTTPAKKGRKPKGNNSRVPTRANSPSSPRPILTRCQHLFCIECYRASICPGWPSVSSDTMRCCSACQTALSPSDAVEIKPDVFIDGGSKRKPQRREKRQKGLPLDHFHPSTKIQSLLGDLVQFSKANPHSVNYDPASLEVQMVDDQGNYLAESIVKTVVFSQWTSMLDKIEDALELAGIRYDRLDGTMKRDDRTRAMDALKYDPACEVLLVSLKAGGVGLNLTAAQRVYLMDPYWNPAVENQAVDRIHRLGQTRPVTTVKLIIENSIEDRLLEVQKKKTELANMTLGQGTTKAELLQRRMDELAQLFGS
ncbi:SNF2 family N-terminal domain-containing protein [Cyathus striatus]|nr:SNF2 family N-terminal domain-containing protein [Cyathus striatus]